MANFDFLKRLPLYWWLRSLHSLVLRINNMDLFHTRCKIINHGTYNVNKCIRGG